MFYSWRIEDRNLSTFSLTQKRQIKNFQEFIMEKPEGFCCICMEVLYVEDHHYRKIVDVSNIHCLRWKIQPLVDPIDEDMKMVCKKHKIGDLSSFPTFKYPGKFCKFFF
jgi:hypothetical protein